MSSVHASCRSSSLVPDSKRRELKWLWELTCHRCGSVGGSGEGRMYRRFTKHGLTSSSALLGMTS
jgi:hypothetical protein